MEKEELKDCIVESNPERDFSNFESKEIKFDKKYKELDSMDNATLTLQLVTNTKRNIFQSFLVSETTKKPFLLPVVSDSEEGIIQASYNLLCDLLDSISDFMTKDGTEAKE